jgi:four helix bundle protein
MSISMGSANEMVVHFEISAQLAYATHEDCQQFAVGYEAIGKQLHMLIARWRSDGRPPTSNI